MNFESFEKEGLKIDRERVLTYSGLSCPLDCTYCFVDDMLGEQISNASYLSLKQLDLLGHLPEQVRLIMLGCDTEFFQKGDGSIKLLEKMVPLRRDVSVVTKMHLTKELIERIWRIDDQLTAQGNLLSLSVSIPCFGSYKKWEPIAPSPEKRIETLRYAFGEGLLTLV